MTTSVISPKSLEFLNTEVASQGRSLYYDVGVPIVGTILSVLVLYFILYFLLGYVAPSLFGTRPNYMGMGPIGGYYYGYGRSNNAAGSPLDIDGQETTDLTAKVTKAIEKEN